MLTTWTEWLGIFTINFIGFISYIIYLSKYWERKNMPYVRYELSKRDKWLGFIIQKYYNWAKASGYKHIGLIALWIPMYMPIDPTIIKNILGKDFNYFSDRGLYANERVDPIGAHLFTLEAKKWKDLRTKVSPAFTPGKLKMMFNALLGVAHHFKEAISEASSSNEPFNMKTASQCFTVDVIGSCAFGLDCNSFKNPNSEFRKYGNKAFNGSVSMLLRSVIGFSCPNISNYCGLRIVDKDVSDFFLNVIQETVEYRKTNNVTRNDFLQILIKLKNDAKYANDDSGLTIEEIAAQCFIFFLAGFETSSNTMTFCLYELVSNFKIQDKVRAEINLVLKKHDDEITYEALAEMTYMEQVIDETLRKYPALPFLTRSCKSDYQIQGTDIVIDKKTLCIIPVYPLHHDPDYFPNPEKFDPERFGNGNKINPSTYLPFGDGPRNCIGLRFGIMQVKVGLIMLLKNFSFSLNEKTVSPLQINPHSYTGSILDALWLNVKQLDHVRSVSYREEAYNMMSNIENRI